MGISSSSPDSLRQQGIRTADIGPKVTRPLSLESDTDLPAPMQPNDSDDSSDLSADWQDRLAQIDVESSDDNDHADTAVGRDQEKQNVIVRSDENGNRDSNNGFIQFADEDDSDDSQEQPKPSPD